MQIGGTVPPVHPLFHCLPHPPSLFRIFEVLGRIDPIQIFIGQTIARHTRTVAIRRGFRLLVEPARSLTAVMGTFDDFLFRIVVGRFGIFVEIKTRKAPRARAIFAIFRIGHTEQIEVDIAFTLVELVVANLVFFVDVAVFLHQLRRRIPLPQTQFEQAITPAEQIEQGPVVETLVEVVCPIAALARA